MRLAAFLLALLAASAPSVAWAQYAPLTPRSDGLRDPRADALGEQTARHRLEQQGYGQVSTLLKDREGKWRGKAVIDGRTVDVTVDRNGNVVRQ